MVFKSDKQRKKVMSNLNPGASSHDVIPGEMPTSKTSNNDNRMLIDIDPKKAAIWNEMNESEKFDVIDEKFYNSNLPNINDLSELSYEKLPEEIREKISRGLKFPPAKLIGKAFSRSTANAVTKRMEILRNPEVQAMDPYSQKELKEVLQWIDDQIYDNAFPSYNWVEIINEGKRITEIYKLIESPKEQAFHFVDISFGYDEPSGKRPETQAEKITAQFDGTYNEINDEKFAYLGDRRKIDYEITKRQVENYFNIIKEDLTKELPRRF